MGANGEELTTCASEHYFFAADAPEHHAAVLESRDRNADGEIGRRSLV
jgi:hypothetical protein